MLITYPCHEPLPSHHTNTEQIVSTASALAHAGAHIRLTFPVPATWPRPTDHEARLGEAYGVPSCRFASGLQLAPRDAPRWARGNAIRLWQAWTAAPAFRTDTQVFYARDPVPLIACLRTGRPTIFETYRLDVSQSARFAIWRRYCYQHPSLLGVVAHSRLARDAVVAAGVPPRHVLVAHNAVPTSGLVDDPGPRSARCRVGLPIDSRLVVYAGHVGPAKGLDAVISLARERPSVTFVVLGHVPGSSGHRWFASAVRQSGLRNVRLIPRVPPPGVADYLFAADVLLIPPTAQPLRRSGRTVLPMKLFTYLAAGRPILAPQLPDVQEILTDHNAALVPADDIGTAIAVLDRLIEDPEHARRLAATARHDALDHTWDRRGERILTFLRGRLEDRLDA